MSDDLVMDLRKGTMFDSDSALMWDAADEIERLRAALKHYACDCAVNQCEVKNESDTICGRTACAALSPAPSKGGDDE